MTIMQTEENSSSVFLTITVIQFIADTAINPLEVHKTCKWVCEQWLCISELWQKINPQLLTNPIWTLGNIMERTENRQNNVPAWSSSDQQSMQEEQSQSLPLHRQRDTETEIEKVKH